MKTIDEFLSTYACTVTHIQHLAQFQDYSEFILQVFVPPVVFRGLERLLLREHRLCESSRVDGAKEFLYFIETVINVFRTFGILTVEIDRDRSG